MMQLGFVTAIVGELSLSQVIHLAAEIGYDCVEVMCWPPSKAERRYAGVTHIDVTNLNDSAIREIRQLCESTGVSISGLGYYPNCLSANRDEAATAVEHLRRVMQAAPGLGIKNVNTFIGRDHTLSVEANWPRLLDTWCPLMELADSLDLRLVLRTAPCCSLWTNGPVERTLPPAPQFGPGCFVTSRARTLG